MPPAKLYGARLSVSEGYAALLPKSAVCWLPAALMGWVGRRQFELWLKTPLARALKLEVEVGNPRTPEVKLP